MSPTARDSYLEAQVRTATPQRLRLMLIDGALRFARLAEEAWARDDRREAGHAAITRCRKIVTELFGTIRPGQWPMAGKVAEIYAFLIRKLAEASLSGDTTLVREVIGVLEQERETWHQLCTKMPEAPERPADMPTGPKEITAKERESIPPPLSGFARPGAIAPSSLSLEA